MDNLKKELDLITSDYERRKTTLYQKIALIDHEMKEELSKARKAHELNQKKDSENESESMLLVEIKANHAKAFFDWVMESAGMAIWGSTDKLYRKFLNQTK